MIGGLMAVYGELLGHYKEKWRKKRIDQKYQDWEEGQEMREDFGFDDKTFQRMPKRKIKNRAARKKHGL